MPTKEFLPRETVQRAVDAVLVGTHGRSAIVERPYRPGASATVPSPADYVQAIAAARAVRDHAEQIMREYACKARSDGYTWAEIAAGLGFRPYNETHLSPEGEAFEMVAWHQRVSWRCGTCAQPVTDYGPYDTNPANREEGHAADCARHRRQIAAYESVRGE